MTKEPLRICIEKKKVYDPSTNRSITNKLYADSDFFEPYILHDEIDVYNKATQQYERRRRTTGISYSRLGEIIISFAYCSNKDVYNKKEAKHIVTGRIVQVITNMKTNNKLTQSFNNNSFYFSNYPTYQEFAIACAAYTNNFMPLRIRHSGSSSDGIYDNTLNTDSRDTSSYHFHIGFVTDTYERFMEVLNREKDQEKDTITAVDTTKDVEENVSSIPDMC